MAKATKTKNRNATCAFSARPRILMALEWYDAKIHEGIAHFAKEAGWILDASMARTNTMPEHWEGDGVITLLNEDNSRYLPYIKALDLPTVGIGYSLQGQYPVILGDHAETGALGAKHFLERNFKNFAFIFFDNSILEKERCMGFEAALEKSGKPFNLQKWKNPIRTKTRSYRHVRDWLVKQLADAPKPLAIMAQNDDSAILILYACIDAGISVPEEIAVIGADNNPLICDFAPIPLSSVDCDLHTLGYTAGHLLNGIINGMEAPGKPVLSPPKGVVLRRSTDISAIENLTIAKAIRFIWDHFDEPINVETIIELTGMSRSQIYQEFDQAIGRSIAKEITRCRINKAKELLEKTELSINEIAPTCGFAGVVSFCRAFARETGCTATGYRQQETQP
ncbi:MAG: DNA-binding transcriptional regulator [Verrucomicrobiota bacterium]|nr:DNA-binding transcriptional regulator [Verrucomicrobiota bacterium]